MCKTEGILLNIVDCTSQYKHKTINQDDVPTIRKKNEKYEVVVVLSCDTQATVMLKMLQRKYFS
jgi:hypothetical protein